MRRRQPRSLAAALHDAAHELAPATTLARAQRCWAEAAGPAVAAEAEPASERDGILTVACSSSVWAHELDLLAPVLLERLNAALADTGAAPPLRGLRLVPRAPARPA
jgi:predicted nucleic acid-binding Zn ribbon protein